MPATLPLPVFRSFSIRGQGMPMFNGDELLDSMRLADFAGFNDYEAKLLCDRTGRISNNWPGK